MGKRRASECDNKKKQRASAHAYNTEIPRREREREREREVHWTALVLSFFLSSFFLIEEARLLSFVPSPKGSETPYRQGKERYPNRRN